MIVIECKQCGKMTDNGTNFCSHKCGLLWKRNHNYTRKDWKRIKQQKELMLIRMSSGTDQGDMGDYRREQ